MRGEHPDVVVLDLMMPILSGWDVLRERSPRRLDQEDPGHRRQRQPRSRRSPPPSTKASAPSCRSRSTSRRSARSSGAVSPRARTARSSSWASRTAIAAMFTMSFTSTPRWSTCTGLAIPGESGRSPPRRRGARAACRRCWPASRLGKMRTLASPWIGSRGSSSLRDLARTTAVSACISPSMIRSGPALLDDLDRVAHLLGARDASSSRSSRTRAWRRAARD